MVSFNLQIHPSIRPNEIPKNISKHFETTTVLEAILSIVADYPQLEALLLVGRDIKPGIMIFSGKTELTSMGLLDQELDDDISVRVVPILHGGST